MSAIDSPAVDCVHPRHGGAVSDQDSLFLERKFDDGVEDDCDSANFCDLVCVRMPKDEPKAVNASGHFNSHSVGANASDVDTRFSDCASCSCSSESNPSSSMLQFFVRGVRTLVMQASPQDTVKSIHERIQAIVGIPVSEQRLIYWGKQLQWEQTLAECEIQNDASLQLVGRMRSTGQPRAWQILNDMVSLIYRLCRGYTGEDATSTIKGLLNGYLGMIPKKEGNHSASSYIQIFASSSAPEALVMLYLSPHRCNKYCADNCIRLFLSSCNALSNSLHTQYARVVLEFCALLRRVGCDDPLYTSCRSTLGSLLETAVVSNSSEHVDELIVVQDIFLFARELANCLLRDLDLCMQSPSNSIGRPSLTVLRDFKAFLLILRTTIRKQQASKGPFSSMKDEEHHKNLLLSEQIKSLHLMFSELLKKMDQCLQSMEKFLAAKKSMEEDLYVGWNHYLNILKELYHISKLCDGAEEELLSVLRCHKNMFCLLIIRYAKRTDNHQWILEHKSLTDFGSRRHLVLMMFPEVKEDYEEMHEMLIDRSQLLAESYEYISRAEPESLHAGLFMEFKNEEATGPGVLREWFILVCQAIFNQQNALFVACPNDHRRFFPNSASKVHPQHLQYFSFSGRVIALALIHKVQVGIVFDRVFFLRLAGRCITLQDTQDADPYLYSSCKKILEMDADFIDSDALGLTFVREVEQLGSRKVVELCPGGESLAVNSKNRENYVDLLIKDRFVTSISKQVEHFARGFADILCNSSCEQFFQSLELEDLDWMLHGSQTTISVEDWKAHTEYNGYKETDPQISWFWEIVGRMSAEERKVLLYFWTSVKYLPVEGFRGLPSPIHINRSSVPVDRLPSSHTCFYQLSLPAYPSMDVMQDRLRTITQEHIGCSFGNC